MSAQNQSEAISLPYTLSAEQMDFRDNVRALAQTKVAPFAADIDRAGEYPQAMFDLLRENDLLSLCLPVEYGGAGASILDTCLAVEEMAACCYNTAYLMVLTLNPFECIFHAGTTQQKVEYLSPLAKGQVRAAFALTEPEAGSDAAALRTRAVRDGDFYVITGQKSFITNAAVADYLVLFARTGQSGTSRDITAFIVPTATPGLAIGPPEHKIGGRALPSSAISLDSCRVPVSSRLGVEGEGFTMAMRGLGRLRPTLSARALGLAEGAFRHATNYLHTRKQFGKSLAEFQGLRFSVAEMATDIEAGRALTYSAAASVDQGEPEQGSYLSNVAKLFTGEMAQRVASTSAQLLGANGVAEDYPAERFVRDSRLLTVAGGTTEIQKVQIADRVLGRIGRGA